MNTYVYIYIRPSVSCPLGYMDCARYTSRKPRLGPCPPNTSCLSTLHPLFHPWLRGTVHMFTCSHVLNSKHFTSVMKEERVKMDETLVSFDVTSLFTNVPTYEAVEVITGSSWKRRTWWKGPAITGEDCRAPPALSEVYLLQLQC